MSKELLKDAAEKVVPSNLEESLIKTCVTLIDRVDILEAKVRRLEGRLSVCR